MGPPVQAALEDRAARATMAQEALEVLVAVAVLGDLGALAVVLEAPVDQAGGGEMEED